MADGYSYEKYFKQITAILFGLTADAENSTENKSKKAEIEVINNLYMKYHNNPSDKNFSNLKNKILKLYISVMNFSLYTSLYTDKGKSDLCSHYSSEYVSYIYENLISLLTKKTINEFNDHKMNTFFEYFHNLVLKRGFNKRGKHEAFKEEHGGIELSRGNEELIRSVNKIMKENNIQKNYEDLTTNDQKTILEQLHSKGKYKSYNIHKFYRKLLECCAVIHIDSPINNLENEILIKNSISIKEHQYNYNEKIEACLDEAIELLKNSLKTKKTKKYLSIVAFNLVTEIVQMCFESAKISYKDISYAEVFTAHKEIYTNIFKKYNFDKKIIEFIENHINEHNKLPNEGHLAKYIDVRQETISRLKSEIKKLNLHNKINIDLTDYNYIPC